MPLSKQVYQFKIVLKGIKPPIWRRIQVPSTYTLYDLHVVIQNVMGWLDSHSHKFSVLTIYGQSLVFGIPTDENTDLLHEDIIIPDWKYNLYIFEVLFKRIFEYYYDRENWIFKIDFEKVVCAEADVIYPRCIKGRRASPPENCDGMLRYAELLTILADSEHQEHEDSKEWIESQTGGSFDSEHFDPAEIVFNDPKARLG